MTDQLKIDCLSLADDEYARVKADYLNPPRVVRKGKTALDVMRETPPEQLKTDRAAAAKLRAESPNNCLNMTDAEWQKRREAVQQSRSEY